MKLWGICELDGDPAARFIRARRCCEVERNGRMRGEVDAQVV